MSDFFSTSRIAIRFIEDAGNVTQSFGLGRVVGQLYACLYFSSAPKNLVDMQASLGISKGSASTAVRQLEQWGAARKVWVKGDRRDYYEACDWFGRILRNAVLETVGKKMASCAALLDEATCELAAVDGRDDDEAVFIRERLEHFRRFQKKAGDILSTPVIQALMK